MDRPRIRIRKFKLSDVQHEALDSLLSYTGQTRYSDTLASWRSTTRRALSVAGLVEADLSLSYTNRRGRYVRYLRLTDDGHEVVIARRAERKARIDQLLALTSEVAELIREG